MYTITDVSKMFNISASTLRYYEKIGLLENVEHKNGYQRIYNESHIDRLNAISCFKKALLPLEEIKAFFEYEKDIRNNSQSILEMMKNQKEKTQMAMKSLEDGLAHIEKKIHYYSLVNESIQANKRIPTWKEVEGE